MDGCKWPKYDVDEEVLKIWRRWRGTENAGKLSGWHSWHRGQVLGHLAAWHRCLGGAEGRGGGGGVEKCKTCWYKAEGNLQVSCREPLYQYSIKGMSSWNYLPLPFVLGTPQFHWIYHSKKRYFWKKNLFFSVFSLFLVPFRQLLALFGHFFEHYVMQKCHF